MITKFGGTNITDRFSSQRSCMIPSKFFDKYANPRIAAPTKSIITFDNTEMAVFLILKKGFSMSSIITTEQELMLEDVVWYWIFQILR